MYMASPTTALYWFAGTCAGITYRPPMRGERFLAFPMPFTTALHGLCGHARQVALPGGGKVPVFPYTQYREALPE